MTESVPMRPGAGMLLPFLLIGMLVHSADGVAADGPAAGAAVPTVAAAPCNPKLTLCQ